MKLFVFLQKELRPDVPKCILLNHKNQQVQKRVEGAKNYVNAFNAFYSFLTKVNLLNMKYLYMFSLVYILCY